MKKRKLWLWDMYQWEKIQQELEKMALQGWILTRCGTYFWTFQKAEPRRLHVAVSYISDGSRYNPAPSDNESFLEELAGQEGWVPAARWNALQIFYNGQPDPVPFHTDREAFLDSMARAVKKQSLPQGRYGIIEGLFLMLSIGLQLYIRPAWVLSRGFLLWIFLTGLLFFLVSFLSVLRMGLWLRKIGKLSETDRIPSPGAPDIPMTLLAPVILGVLPFFLTESGPSVLLIFATFGIALGVYGGLCSVFQHMGMGARENLRMCSMIGMTAAAVLLIAGFGLIQRYHWAEANKPVGTYSTGSRESEVFAAPIPLKIQDYAAAGDLEWSTEETRQASFLLSSRIFRQWALTPYHTPYARYEILDTFSTFAYELCRNKWLHTYEDSVRHGEVMVSHHFVPVDPGPWEAEEVYQEQLDGKLLSEYVLCYENRLIYLKAPQPLSPEAVPRVGKILRTCP